MNEYEQKQAARKARFKELAEKASAESTRIYNRARGMGDAIPFGQPILVGHHSEKRDRNFRARIHNTYGKAFTLQDKAKYYERKAEGVGSAGISSDDPDAVEKLRTELASIEQAQARMKAANKAIRGNKTQEARIAALIGGGLTEAQAAELLKPDFLGRIGFPDYALKNNNANARRVRARIAELEKRSQRDDVEQLGEGFTYREDTTENRVMFIFQGKPAPEVREVLKRHAFKWSPSRGAWVRQLNSAGIWAGKQVKEAIGAA